MSAGTAKTRAVSWSATMGLIPGYGHDNDPDVVAERKALLIRVWREAMEDTKASTGYTISAVLTDSTVIYPVTGGCPPDGEQAVTLSGSSNPAFVPEPEFEAFMHAVEAAVLHAQSRMEQTSVRIEFSILDRSVYSRVTA